MKALSENIFMFDFDVAMGPGLKLPGRSLVYRENGRVILFSPGPFTEEEYKKIHDFGQVVAVVAPNMMHHKWAPVALAKFPQAKLFRPEGLEEKEPALAHRGEAFDRIGFLNFKDMEFQVIGGMPKIQECVFYFKQDKVLYVQDMVFHILKPASFLSGLMLTLAGTKGRLATSKLMNFLVKDEGVFKRDVAKVFDWNFDKVIMAHGEPLLQDGKFRLQEAYRKYLS